MLDRVGVSWDLCLAASVSPTIVLMTSAVSVFSALDANQAADGFGSQPTSFTRLGARTGRQ
jgi:hypothetical protein